jgi:phosphatidate cytidylyltransferase
LSAGPPGAAAPDGEKPKTSGWSLRWRVVSGVVFVPLLILLARAGGLAWASFVAMQVMAGLVEFYGMARGKGLRPHLRLGLVAGVGTVATAFRPHVLPGELLATAAVLLALALALRHAPDGRRMEGLAVTLFGVLYVGWLSAHLVLLRELPWSAGLPYADGAWFVLLAFFVTWSCDTGAYAVGRMFGRIRPWPVSPRKSLEGVIGGLAAAVIAGFVARAWFAPWLRPVDAAAVGLLAGVTGQVGDFVESWLKRDARHGDSGELIPGHGGILDRFDSLYFAAPALYYYLKLVVWRVP